MCITMSSFAQDPATHVKTFFNTYKSDPGKAIVDIHKTNKWNESRVQTITNIKNLVGTFQKTMGNYYGYENWSSEKVSPSIERHMYIVKYDQHPLIFSFVFYKPSTKWVLYSFNIDDSFIKEAKNDKGGGK